MAILKGRFPDKSIEDMVTEAGEPVEIDWVEFRGRQHGRFKSGDPRITMDHKGSIYMNAAAYRALGQPLAAEILLDKMRRVIGVVPANQLNENAFIIKTHGRKNSTSRRIAASAFCQHFGIKVSGTILFHNVIIDREGVLRLDLVNATRIGRGAR